MKHPGIFQIMILTVILFILGSGTGCEKRFAVKKTDSDSIASVPDDDAEMNRIIEEARSTISDFLESMENPEDDESEFRVKYPFETDKGSEITVEHIWLNDIVKRDEKYFAIVANDPFYIAAMKYGDETEFDITLISDWFYFKGEKIVGGKSIKYLIENIPDKDRSDDEKKLLELFD